MKLLKHLAVAIMATTVLAAVAVGQGFRPSDFPSDKDQPPQVGNMLQAAAPADQPQGDQPGVNAPPQDMSGMQPGSVHVTAQARVRVEDTPKRQQRVYMEKATQAYLDAQARVNDLQSRSRGVGMTAAQKHMLWRAQRTAADALTKVETLRKNVYLKKEIDAKLAGKANVGDSYSKTESDDKYATKADLKAALYDKDKSGKLTPKYATMEDLGAFIDSVKRFDGWITFIVIGLIAAIAIGFNLRSRRA